VRDNLTQGQTYSPRGIFEYAEGQTGLNAPGQKTSFGDDFASFLLDLPNTVGRDVNVGSGSWRQMLYFVCAGQMAGDTQFDLDLRRALGVPSPANPDRKGGFSQYNPADNTLHVPATVRRPTIWGCR
jgi:hypothetical protein